MNSIVRKLPSQLLFSSRLIKSQVYFGTSADTVKKQIEGILEKNKVVVFMKGNPEAPKCGFSNAVVQIMRMHGVTYDSHDVLQSDDLRQGNNP